MKRNAREKKAAVMLADLIQAGQEAGLTLTIRAPVWRELGGVPEASVCVAAEVPPRDGWAPGSPAGSVSIWMLGPYAGEVLAATEVWRVLAWQLGFVSRSEPEDERRALAQLEACKCAHSARLEASRAYARENGLGEPEEKKP